MVGVNMKVTTTEEYRKFAKKIYRNKNKEYMEHQMQNLQDTILNKQERNRE